MEMQKLHDESENSPLVEVTNSSRRVSTKSKFVIGFIVIVAVSSIAGVVINSMHHHSTTKCVLSVYDVDGNLLNDTIPCSVAMRSVIASHYLPITDVYSNTLNGMQIFKPFPERCFSSRMIRQTTQRNDAYENVDAFYKRISTDTDVSLDLIGKKTLGATLEVKTNLLSDGSTDVKGTSIEIFTHTRAISLDPSCFRTSDGQLTDDILKDFDDLQMTIPDPSSTESWQMYNVFLKKYGSHFTSQVIMGSYLRQWTFSKSSESYTMTILTTKACLDLFGLVFRVPVEFDFCNKVIKETRERTEQAATTSSLEIRGCTDATRNKLLLERTPELIERMLNEGRRMESPVAYKFTPIWEIFLMKYGRDKKRFQIAMNMKQYYKGFLDFGCSLVEIGGIRAREFKYRNNDNRHPIFQCQLAKEGCRSDSDCHIGPSLSVTYCYGYTCLKYADPPFGSKAKTVVSRKSRYGSYNEGINDSCYYKVGVTAGCDNDARDLVIWEGSAH